MRGRCARVGVRAERERRNMRVRGQRERARESERGYLCAGEGWEGENKREEPRVIERAERERERENGRERAREREREREREGET